MSTATFTTTIAEKKIKKLIRILITFDADLFFIIYIFLYDSFALLLNLGAVAWIIERNEYNSLFNEVKNTVYQFNC